MLKILPDDMPTNPADGFGAGLRRGLLIGLAINVLSLAVLTYLLHRPACF